MERNKSNTHKKYYLKQQQQKKQSIRNHSHCEKKKNKKQQQQQQLNWATNVNHQVKWMIVCMNIIKINKIVQRKGHSYGNWVKIENRTEKTELAKQKCSSNVVFVITRIK